MIVRHRSIKLNNVQLLKYGRIDGAALTPRRIGLVTKQCERTKVVISNLTQRCSAVRSFFCVEPNPGLISPHTHTING